MDIKLLPNARTGGRVISPMRERVITSQYQKAVSPSRIRMVSPSKATYAPAISVPLATTGATALAPTVDWAERPSQAPV